MKNTIRAETLKFNALFNQNLSRHLNWSKKDTLKILLITEKQRIPQSQIFPFFYYLDKLKKKWNIELLEVNIDDFEKNNTAKIYGADKIFFQPWFTRGNNKIVELLSRLKDTNPKAAIVFFDSYAPTDLRFASLVNPYIDWYVKKHVLRNRETYNIATHGDTTLVEYFNEIYGLGKEPKVLFPVPDSFFKKLIIGPSFFTDKTMLPFIENSTKPFDLKKTIALHARMAVKGTPWYESMRDEALKNARGLGIASSEVVSFRKYMMELRSAHICFSPFGYGETCWRDYEAVFAGAMLIKPDMSHVETIPNIFIPNISYVPVKWDFSDLKEKFDVYINDLELQQKIVSRSYDVLRDYVKNDELLNQYSNLFN